MLVGCRSAVLVARRAAEGRDEFVEFDVSGSGGDVDASRTIPSIASLSNLQIRGDPGEGPQLRQRDCSLDDPPVVENRYAALVVPTGVAAELDPCVLEDADRRLRCLQVRRSQRRRCLPSQEDERRLAQIAMSHRSAASVHESGVYSEPAL